METVFHGVFRLFICAEKIIYLRMFNVFMSLRTAILQVLQAGRCDLLLLKDKTSDY